MAGATLEESIQSYLKCVEVLPRPSFPKSNDVVMI